MATTLTVLTILVVFGLLLSRASRRTKPGGRGTPGGADGGVLIAGDGSTADGGHHGRHDHALGPGGHVGHGAAHDGGAGSHGGDAGGGGHGGGDVGGGDGGGGHG